MPNNKDHKKTGSQDPMKNTSSGREFDGQGKNPGSGKGDQGQQASGFRKGTQGEMEDDEMNTAGGREGQFSDKNRGTEGQWSPGSSQSSDE